MFSKGLDPSSLERAPSPPGTLKVHLKNQKLKGAMLEMLENNIKNLGPVCLLKSIFFLENKFRKNKLFFDVW